MLCLRTEPWQPSLVPQSCQQRSFSPACRRSPRGSSSAGRSSAGYCDRPTGLTGFPSTARRKGSRSRTTKGECVGNAASGPCRILKGVTPTMRGQHVTMPRQLGGELTVLARKHSVKRHITIPNACRRGFRRQRSHNGSAICYARVDDQGCPTLLFPVLGTMLPNQRSLRRWLRRAAP